ncbi:unnamed protein product [Owenia fusiformis]|uniref:C2H2-type domain-containing protein n=1 Tax=Owenia fusiformis TaxID=6347 RepID=A0A8S4P757_OWEFU|nr:unnamed protein product [Owenia fusiformis]
MEDFSQEMDDSLSSPFSLSVGSLGVPQHLRNFVKVGKDFSLPKGTKKEVSDSKNYARIPPVSPVLDKTRFPGVTETLIQREGNCKRGSRVKKTPEYLKDYITPICCISRSMDGINWGEGERKSRSRSRQRENRRKARREYAWGIEAWQRDTGHVSSIGRGRGLYNYAQSQETLERPRKIDSRANRTRPVSRESLPSRSSYTTQDSYRPVRGQWTLQAPSTLPATQNHSENPYLPLCPTQTPVITYVNPTTKPEASSNSFTQYQTNQSQNSSWDNLSLLDLGSAVGEELESLSSAQDIGILKDVLSEGLGSLVSPSGTDINKDVVDGGIKSLNNPTDTDIQKKELKVSIALNTVSVPSKEKAKPVLKTDDEVIPETGGLACGHCQKTFKRRSSLAIHIKDNIKGAQRGSRTET